MATLANATRSAACDAIVDLLDGGTLVFETSIDGEVATLTFGTPAFGAASDGVATANAITSDTNATGGTISKAMFVTSGAADVLQATVGTSGAEINLSSLSVTAGDTVSISSLTVTVPAS